jgi:hypothetical protein
MLNPASEISLGNFPEWTCVSLCETLFRPTECVTAQVRCDETTSICTSLRWKNSRKTRLCLDPKCGTDAVAIPCSEEEASSLRRSRAREGEESKLKKKNRVGFADTEDTVRLFRIDSTVMGQDVVVSPKSNEGIRVTGVDWGLFGQLYADLRHRTSIERTTSEHSVFPGVQACLGVPPHVMINTRQEIISVYFDQELVSQMDSVPRINSLSGPFSLWKLPSANSATWFKAVGGALNGMEGMGVHVFDMGMTNPACEPWFMVTEAQGREPLGQVSSTLTGLSVGMAKAQVSPTLTGLSVGMAKAIAVRLFQTVKYLHIRGLVHQSLHNSFYWDGTNVESIKVGNYGLVQFFIDPSGGSHVSVDKCRSNPSNTFQTIRYPPPNNCISRHVDFEDIFALLRLVSKRLVPDATGNDLVANFDRFGQEVALMGFMDTLDYDKWITLFRD